MKLVISHQFSIKTRLSTACVYLCVVLCNIVTLLSFVDLFDCFQRKTGKISRRCQNMAPFRKTSEKQSMNYVHVYVYASFNRSRGLGD